jgi:hypothetical protein
MKKKLFCFFILIIFIKYNVNAISFGYFSDNKDTIKNSYHPQVSLGIGAGLDYGGFGGRLTSLPYKYLSLFIGFGYNLSDVGVNLGGSLRLLPNNLICPTISGMYGYNAVIIVTGAKNTHETYYGGSLGFGLELRSKKLKNYLSFGLYIPFRSEAYNNEILKLSLNPNISITNEPDDVIFTIGYHIII